MDCTLPVSSVHGIFQTRTLEWVALSFSWDLPNSATAPTSLVSPASQADSLSAEPSGKPVLYVITVPMGGDSRAGRYSEHPGIVPRGFDRAEGRAEPFGT